MNYSYLTPEQRMSALLDYQRMRRRHTDVSKEAKRVLSLHEAERTVERDLPPACCSCLPLHRLVGGVKSVRRHYWTLQLGVACLAWATVVFNGAILPLLVGQGFLNIPSGEQATALGRITSAAQIGAVLAPLPLGIISRARPALVVDLVLVGALMAVQPLVARGSEAGLIGVRAVHAFVVQGLPIFVIPMLSAVVPPSSAGAFGGITQALGGLGIVFSLLVWARLPSWLADAGIGVDLATGALAMFLFVGALLVAVALAVCLCTVTVDPDASDAAGPNESSNSRTQLHKENHGADNIPMQDITPSYSMGRRPASAASPSAPPSYSMGPGRGATAGAGARAPGTASSSSSSPASSSRCWQLTGGAFWAGICATNVALLSAYAGIVASRVNTYLVMSLVVLTLAQQAQSTGQTPTAALQSATLLVGGAQAAYTVGALVSGALFDPMSRCLTPPVTAAVFYSVGGLACTGLWIHQAFSADAPLPVWVATVSAVSFGDAFVSTAAYALQSTFAPASSRGVIASMFAMVGELALLALAPVLGLLYDQYGGLAAAALFVAMVNFCAMMTPSLLLVQKCARGLAHMQLNYREDRDGCLRPSMAAAAADDAAAAASLTGADAPVFKCPFCDNQYPLSADVEEHIRRRHPGMSAPLGGGAGGVLPGSYAMGRVDERLAASSTSLHRCNECGASYVLHTDLMWHRQLRGHGLTAAGDHVCHFPGCNRSFPSPNALLAHRNRANHYWLSGSDF